MTARGAPVSDRCSILDRFRVVMLSTRYQKGIPDDMVANIYSGGKYDRDKSGCDSPPRDK